MWESAAASAPGPEVLTVTARALSASRLEEKRRGRSGIRGAQVRLGVGSGERGGAQAIEPLNAKGMKLPQVGRCC